MNISPTIDLIRRLANAIRTGNLSVKTQMLAELKRLGIPLKSGSNLLSSLACRPFQSRDGSSEGTVHHAE